MKRYGVVTGVCIMVGLTLFLNVVSICFAEGTWMTCKEQVTLWNPNPKPNESCSWTGAVDESQKAHGTGVVVWFEDGTMSQVSIIGYKNGNVVGVYKNIEKDGTISVAQSPQLSTPTPPKEVTPKPLPTPTPDIEGCRVRCFNRVCEPQERACSSSCRMQFPGGLDHIVCVQKCMKKYIYQCNENCVQKCTKFE